jgi:hypothetical protein
MRDNLTTETEEGSRYQVSDGLCQPPRRRHLRQRFGANGLALNAGYGRLDDDSVVSDVIGIKLGYAVEGALR